MYTSTDDGIERLRALLGNGQRYGPVLAGFDGVLAVFDAPGRAVRCAQAILNDIHQLGCDAYAGLHAGEVELLGDDIAGIAVHIAARV